MSCPKCKAPLEAHEVSPGVVVHHCPACYGVLYAAGDLAVPLKLAGAAPARFDCPRCRRPMDTARGYDGQIEVDRCAACQVLWFDAGEIQILRKLAGVEEIAVGQKKAAAAPVAPPAAAAGKAPKAVVPPEMEGAKNPDADRAPTVEFEGRVYRHFQTSVPVTTAVLGEFPWIAAVGDAARARDFISPPYLLSQEVTATESVWSAGEYIEPGEIWAAFSLPGSPPPPRDVAPAQPNPWSGHLPAVRVSCGLAAAACLGAYAFFASYPGSGDTVYSGSFTIGAAEAERSRVSEVFTVGGRTSNLELLIDSNLDQQWAYVSMALIDADTDRALDFGRELSYYHGYEDGESWSEGGRYGRLYVPRVPPGRYYLRLEPETDSRELNLRVVARRDVPLARLPALALLALLLPPLWGALRENTFETSRWMESDHPRASSDDDEDDE